MVHGRSGDEIDEDEEVVDEDGVRRVVIELWPTAYRFARGRRLRLQVASGASPASIATRTAAPLGESATLLPAD